MQYPPRTLLIRAVPHRPEFRRPATHTRSPSPLCCPQQQRSYVPRIEYKSKHWQGGGAICRSTTSERSRERVDRHQRIKSNLRRYCNDICSSLVAADKASDIAQSQKQWLCACRCCLDCAHPQFQISKNETTGYRLVWCCAWSNFQIVLNVNIMHQRCHYTKLSATY